MYWNSVEIPDTIATDLQLKLLVISRSDSDKPLISDQSFQFILQNLYSILDIQWFVVQIVELIYIGVSVYNVFEFMK